MTTVIGGSYPAVNSDSDATINGLTVGKGGGAVSTNTAVGYQAINATATGIYNVGVGYSALSANTSGEYNTAVGGNALQISTTGVNNSAFGLAAMAFNTSGGYNTALGMQALRSNTTASNNTAVGYQAGYSNTTGSPNTFIGYQAGYSNQTGLANTAVGYSALRASTVNSNTAMGYLSLTTNTTGASNCGFGQDALGLNTTGGYNSAFGTSSLYNNTTASNNTAVGYQSAYSNTTGTNNTFYGHQSGYYVTTGSKNTIVGRYDGNQGGLDIRTSSNRIVLSDGDGHPALYYLSPNSWCINSVSGDRYSELDFRIGAAFKASMYWDTAAAGGVGALFVAGASGGVYLTNTGTSWIANSDERLKENLVPIENGLEKVCSLRSVIGNFITDENKKPTPFLIAQDVQTVLPEAVTSSTIKGDETEYLGVAYTEVIPLLVAAIKELKAEVDSLKQQLGK